MKTKKLSFRVNEKEHQKLEILRNNQFMNISNLLRTLLINYLDNMEIKANGY